MKLGIVGMLTSLAFTPCLSLAVDKVVYGPDDRLDVFESTNALHVELARSTAGMIPIENLTIGTESSSINGSSLRSRGICSGEKFAEQMTSANCSGFLVTKNLLVTAGHCIRSMTDCQSSAWVFDYSNKTRPSSLKEDGDEAATEDLVFSVPNSSVYRCVEVVETVLDNYGTENDYALIRLDRDVTDRAPLRIRTEGKIADRAGIVVIGHPTGLPTKISGNANVRKNTSDYFFVANLDTFGGNSGSAVFDVNTGLVEGILVRGESDYDYDRNLGCRRPKYCADSACRGEDVTRITNIKKLVDIVRAETSSIPGPVTDAGTGTDGELDYDIYNYDN